MAFLNTLCSTICSSWHSQAPSASLGTFCLWSFLALSSHSSDIAYGPSVQWERSCVRYRRLQIQTPVRWSPHPHYSLWKCRWNTLALWYTSNMRIQCSAAERPGVRHRQMALLLVTWWQIYTAGARPLLMLLLDRVGLKTMPTITFILQSVKSTMYWALSQHRFPANP